MALFKIFKGNDSEKITNPSAQGYREPTDGYAYYDTSTKLFYIDAPYTENSSAITREPINANRANVADLSDLATLAVKSYMMPYVKNGTGTAAVTTTSQRYFTKWRATLPGGITQPEDGLYFVYKIPIGGNGTCGNCLNINPNSDTLDDYHPVVSQLNTISGTRYSVHSDILLIYDSSISGTVYVNGKSTSITGCWVIVNDYDANVNTLQRTYRRSTNVELPITGITTTTATSAAYSAISSGSYKDVYAAIPENTSNVATINPSTGKITVPGGVVANLTGTASQATADGSGNNIVNTYLTKATGVTNVTWNSTDNKLTKTINGTTSDVVTISTIKTALNLATVATSGSYNDLSDTPTIPVSISELANDMNYATQSYVDDSFAANDAMIFKGTLAGAASTTYTPAAERGHTYKVSAAGLINGEKVEVGDLLICITDETVAATSSNVNTVKSNWTIVQTNLDGAVIGPATATNNAIALFDNTTGKIIKDSAKTITTTAPSSSSTDSVLPTSKAVWSAITSASGYGKTGTVTSVRVQATSPVVSSSSAAQSTSLNTTISLADAYGDTKNPYGSKTANYVLAAPNGSAGVPTFRALVAADIPSITKSKISDFPTALSSFTNDSGYVTSSGVTSITLKAGSGISLDVDNTAITTTGTRTITHQTPTGASSGVKGNTATGALEFIKTITTDAFGHVTAYTTGTLTVYDGSYT